MWWNLLNIAVFHGKLPYPKTIQLIAHKDEFAWVHPSSNRTVKLTICPKFVSRELFLSILVHEMVHAWDHMKDRVMNHGRKFFRWKNRIIRTTNLILRKAPNENEYNYRMLARN